MHLENLHTVTLITHEGCHTVNDCQGHVINCSSVVPPSGTSVLKPHQFHLYGPCYSRGRAMGHRPIQQKNGPLTTEVAILNLEIMAHWNFKFIGNKWTMAHTMVCPAITLMDHLEVCHMFVGITLSWHMHDLSHVHMITNILELRTQKSQSIFSRLKSIYLTIIYIFLNCI